MREYFELILQKVGLEMLIINMIVSAGIILIYMRVFRNFKDAKKRENKVEKEVKSIVETLSMSIFFFLCFIVIVLKLGKHNYHNLVLNIIATIVYIIGIAFNLLGRFYLGNNWGNNVVIYNDHTFVNKGVYKLVRHPLYSSIIWMIYSISILYQNYMVAVLNTIIFIPFMYYRAKQEEKELKIKFNKYEQYINQVGMFFPKIIKSKVK